MSCKVIRKRVTDYQLRTMTKNRDGYVISKNRRQQLDKNNHSIATPTGKRRKMSIEREMN